eukprot:404208_1
MEVVDDNHMFVIYPEDEPTIRVIRRRGQDDHDRRTRARLERYTTPKYVPQWDPSWPDPKSKSPRYSQKGYLSSQRYILDPLSGRRTQNSTAR